jgi:MscS family membrane protein
MLTFWKTVFLDNTLLQYAVVGAVILLAWLFKKYIGRYVSSLFFLLMRGMGKDLDRKAFVNLIIGPVENFLLVWISYVAIHTLAYPRLMNIPLAGLQLSDYAEGLFKFLLIFYFFRMLLRLVDYLALVMGKKAAQTPSPDDDQLIVFFKDFLKIVLFIVGILVVLKVVFIQDISRVLAGLSIIGAAIALAARESIENLIASFIIFFDKPFMTGDLLKVNNISGTVERIGLRSTRIRTVEKTYVSVPNKQMVDSIVDNMSLRSHRRGELKIVVDSKATPPQIETFMKAVRLHLAEKQTIIDHNVQFAEINQQGLVITIDYLSTVIDFKTFNQQKDQFNLAILQLLHEHGLSLSGEENVIRITKDLLSSPGEIS